ncbi:PREDICTED: protein RoBo-1-like isoform X3 [Propithecus coquereli]|uniref:protein RoBo-1-like isoform X3 n=1 Tax=Propithecus coquereli TaxID=379532 RepID=UPI00063EF848|nr:PREDICTED: protein RoBo-1-like isoform X3 [Propithecus coquereli]
MLQPSGRKSLLALCVLAACALSTVESYVCTQCFLDECGTDKQTTCEASHGCFSNKQEYNTSGQPSSLLELKGCSPSTCVPLSFSATLGKEMTFAFGRQCCEGPQCNQGEAQAPQKSSDSNGITCHACYSETDIACTTAPLTCTGAETKCVEVIGTGGNMLVRFGMGCATETACNLKGEIVLGSLKINTYCVDPISGSRLLTPILSSTLTGLFLLKVLL